LEHSYHIIIFLSSFLESLLLHLHHTVQKLLSP
jgi:hypothetical protein